MAEMAKIEFGALSSAWPGEARDFTPLLAAQVDILGSALRLDLASVGEPEVATDGGRSIDIVANDADGAEFVIENQYRRADHDHLTRGLAYAVARRARGLIVVAEAHRDEFRAVAQYLNEMAEHDPERGILVWLVEAKAIRIDDSRWAPLFQVVVEPNSFTATVEQARHGETRPRSDEDFWNLFESTEQLLATKQVLSTWLESGYRRRLGPDHVVLEAVGPSRAGIRTVVAIYPNGRVMVPFSSYGGQNSGIPIEALTTGTFRSSADVLFGFSGTERLARTKPGWLTRSTVDGLLNFCNKVADAYAEAMLSESSSDSSSSSS